MAEGGDTFAFEDKDLDDKIDNDDDEQEVNRQEVIRQETFDPTRASTPYGEQYEMQTMQEQSGLHDTSYEETPLLSGSIRDADIERRLAALRKDPLTGIINTTRMMDTSINPLSPEDRSKQIESVKKLIKSQYPNANFKNLPIAFSTKKPMDIVALGPKGGETRPDLCQKGAWSSGKRNHQSSRSPHNKKTRRVTKRKSRFTNSTAKFKKQR